MVNLTRYLEKRDFNKSPEPKGRSRTRKKKGKPAGLLFVVQMHDARRLHYDFRLEWDGTLKSWAVPKGPSNDPDDKRLAVHVEDHPLEYAEFEGNIPKGEYGAGSVLIWDAGIWEPEEGYEDVSEALEKGSLKFTLQGERLKGAWALVRMKGRGDDDQWLLIKHADKHAARNQKTTLVERETGSVVSKRSIDDIAGDNGDGPTRKPLSKSPANSARKSAPEKLEPQSVNGATRLKSSPASPPPQLATLVDEVPEGDDWAHEIKFDGYRLLARKNGNSVTLLTRNGKNWTKKFPETSEAIQQVEGDFILDGELVALDAKGVSQFQDLQQTLRKSTTEKLVFYVFDCLWWNGYDLRKASLEDRKRVAAFLLSDAGKGSGQRIRYSDHLAGRGKAFFKKACEQKLEGIICKKLGSRYLGKRTRTWLKVKCGNRQEFIIGGFTEPQGSRTGFGALLLGVMEGGEFRYCGKVGTGFNETLLNDLHEKLKNRTRKSPAFLQPPTGSEAAGVTWVTPDLVCEIAFTNWTEDGRLRHPVFKGLREDKPASEVHAEFESSPDAAMKVLSIQISHPEREVFPDAGITKADVAEYYAGIADRMLPFLKGRPCSVVRCPRGSEKECFFQKHRGEGMPKVIAALDVGDDQPYLSVNSPDGLVALAQFGAIELHAWLARADALEKPDRLIFDLDPGEGVEVQEVLGAAFLTRDVLQDLGLKSFPLITGGKGIHVVAPLTRRATWDAIRPAAKAIARIVAAKNPKQFVTTATKAKRTGKIYIDWLRNGRGATAVAPYSLRARKGAPVAVPIRWDEIDSNLKPNAYSLKTLSRRLSALKEDPWAGFFETRQSLTQAALDRLELE